MNTKDPLVRWTQQGALAALVIAATATAAHADTSFEAALERYQQSHWPAAYEGFVRLADQGHADAARISLLMLRHSQALYRTPFNASPTQVERWLALATQQRPLSLQASASDRP